MLPVLKHVYLWLPYTNAAVGNSVVNSVTVFAHYFCGDHLPSHTIVAFVICRCVNATEAMIETALRLRKTGVKVSVGCEDEG